MNDDALKLRRLREATHLNQTEFAKQLRCNYQTYIKWEHGKNPIPPYAMLAAEFVSAQLENYDY